MVWMPDVAEGIRGTLNIKDEGLLYIGPGRRYLFEWNKITNIFQWRHFNALAVINKEGRIICGHVQGDKEYGNSFRKIEYIYRVWGEHIKTIEEVPCFEVPDWARRNESKFRLNSSFWGVGGGITIILMAVGALRDNNWSLSEIKEDWPIVLGFLFGLYAFIFGLKNVLEARQKKWVDIRVNENELTITYDNNTSEVLDLLKVKNHNLGKYRYKGFLFFQDGTRVKNLERVSNWPILREHLLSQLEPSDKAEDKSV